LNSRDLSPNITETGILIYEISLNVEGYYLVTGKSETDEVYKIRLF